MNRQTEPEILDHLAADDPEAVRSRRDLRLINFLMGNERWILRQTRKLGSAIEQGGIAELGAGEGILVSRLQRQHPGATTDAYDLAPCPRGVDRRVRWHQGDALVAVPADPQGLLVANLFLHHFEGPALDRLASWCERFQALCFVEPLRSRLALAQGALLHPLVNRVTRHDMPVSIRAGFIPGELPALLKLDPKRWNILERSTWRGAIRVLAWRT